MKKILVTDYDNTFFQNEEELYNNIQMANKFMDDGNIFVIATGRSFLDISTEIKKYNIKFDYLIINHGSTIVSKDNEVLFNYHINDDIKSKVISDINFEKSIIHFGCNKLESRLDIHTSNLTKLHIAYENVKEAEFTNKVLNQKHSDYIKCYLISNIIEVVSHVINKSNAIEKIAAIENVNINKIYTIGDNYNDLEMITDYNGFCMINSVPILKTQAKCEYSSVDKLICDLLGENYE